MIWVRQWLWTGQAEFLPALQLSLPREFVIERCLEVCYPFVPLVAFYCALKLNPVALGSRAAFRSGTAIDRMTS